MKLNDIKSRQTTKALFEISAHRATKYFLTRLLSRNQTDVILGVVDEILDKKEYMYTPIPCDCIDKTVPDDAKHTLVTRIVNYTLEGNSANMLANCCVVCQKVRYLVNISAPIWRQSTVYENTYLIAEMQKLYMKQPEWPEIATRVAINGKKKHAWVKVEVEVRATPALIKLLKKQPPWTEVCG